MADKTNQQLDPSVDYGPYDPYTDSGNGVVSKNGPPDDGSPIDVKGAGRNTDGRNKGLSYGSGVHAPRIT